MVDQHHHEYLVDLFTAVLAWFFVRLNLTDEDYCCDNAHGSNEKLDRYQGAELDDCEGQQKSPDNEI